MCRTHQAIDLLTSPADITVGGFPIALILVGVILFVTFVAVYSKVAELQAELEEARGGNRGER